MPSKRTNKLLFLLLIAFCSFSCGTQTDSRNEGSGEEDLPLDESLVNSEEYQLWETILGDFRDAMFRGISFGDTREKVRITETFELFEELPSQIGYTHDTKELETVDVYYHFSDDDQVNLIVVDVFLNGDESAQRLWEIVTWHFTGPWGDPVEATSTRNVWETPNARVEIENVSGGIDHGLKIRFSSPLMTRLTQQ